MQIKKLLMSALLCSAFLITGVFANEPSPNASDLDDPFAEEEIEWLNVVPPTSYWGVRGLTQTVAAEPLGAGRFSLALYGSYFKQDQAWLRSPNKGADVTTFRGAFSWGLNDQIDLFGIIPFYLLSDDDETKFNIGGLTGGLQYNFPFPAEIPFRLALQIQISTGIRTGGDKAVNNYDITTNYNYWRDGDGTTTEWDEDEWGGLSNLNYAGFDYWDARKRDQNDVIFKVAQSFVSGNLRRALKLHLNEGIVITQGTNDYLLLIAAGLQIDATEFLTIGFEGNWRTLMHKASFTDPLWITPSLIYRSKYYSEGLFGMSFVAGADIRMSQAKTGRLYENIYKDDGTLEQVRDIGETKDMRPLEPWRAFADVVFSFDRFASRRAEIERERRASNAEKARLRREAQRSQAQRDSIARAAHADSLRLAAEMAQRAHADSIRAKAVADSLAALMGDQAEKARQDSIAAAHREAALVAGSEAQLAEAEQRRVADSIAFAHKLAEERAKRSEQEQMLLSTGMLVLADVNFETGKAVLHRNSRPYLQIIAKMLVKYPKLKIEIQGHTDNTGRFETNMALSQARSESVMLFMQSVEPGLAQAHMLSAKGYGSTVPKADNNTAAGREENRRVELKVLNPEILKDYNP
ncbi:MAG: OmpA family protein [Chitinispirillia bacterium]|nr:OmpA family protein [Chitinispirillia bacterium]MCL2268740.1 OmpA family protein [Chitinispirillia bacterium]